MLTSHLDVLEQVESSVTQTMNVSSKCLILYSMHLPFKICVCVWLGDPFP